MFCTWIFPCELCDLTCFGKEGGNLLHSPIDMHVKGRKHQLATLYLRSLLIEILSCERLFYRIFRIFRRVRRCIYQEMHCVCCKYYELQFCDGGGVIFAQHYILMQCSKLAVSFVIYPSRVFCFSSVANWATTCVVLFFLFQSILYLY